MGVNTITDTKVGNWDTAFGWGDHSVAGYLSNVVEDTTPQLGGDLDVQTNEIISTGANNIGLHSNASAYVELGDNLGSNSFDIRDNASGVKLQILSSGDTGIGKSTSLSTAWLSISTSNNNRAHINLEGSSVDKTTPVDGDLWYNTTAGTLNFYDGSTTTDLLAGGGGGAWTDTGSSISYSGFGSYTEFKDDYFQIAPLSSSNTLGAFNQQSIYVGTSLTGGSVSTVSRSVIVGNQNTVGGTSSVVNSMLVGSTCTLRGAQDSLIVGSSIDILDADQSLLGGGTINGSTGDVTRSFIWNASSTTTKLNDTSTGLILLGASENGFDGDLNTCIGGTFYSHDATLTKNYLIGDRIEGTVSRQTIIGMGTDSGVQLQLASGASNGVHLGVASTRPSFGMVKSTAKSMTTTATNTAGLAYLGTGLPVSLNVANTGDGALWIEDAITVPTATISGAGALYVESGALKFRGGSGTVTTIAVA
jgi:hypothetical protein